MKKFALLVGNGFTLDFMSSHDMKFNSSRPLKNFDSLDISYGNFIDFLPAIKNELLGQDINDFEAIANYASTHKVGSSEECQLRRFLAASYSLLQLKLDDYDISQWKWEKWLRENKNNLICSISFNYDLVLERALKSARVPYSRSGTNEVQKKVPIIKPHGSIDFDIPKQGFKIPYQSIWNSTFTLNDFGVVEIVPKWEWFLPRFEADIIPPSMENYQERLTWVKTLPEVYNSVAKDIEALIIIGSSYWDVDRPEIDRYLEGLPKTAIVYIANLEPEEVLLEKISSLGLSFETFGFDELPW